MSAESMPEQQERNVRKVMRGMVTSTKMDKTIVVQVDRKVRHPHLREVRFEAHQALCQ